MRRKRKRCRSANEFGHPEVLSKALTHSEIDNDKWNAIWPIACPCGGKEFEIFDYVGQEDRCDTLFQIQCASCRRRMEPLNLSTDDSEDRMDWDSELEESVPCGLCRQRGPWQLKFRFRYESDLQDQADDDFPEYYEEGLANQWMSFELLGKCKCGHEATLIDYKSW
jgi:hypothetical protein